MELIGNLARAVVLVAGGVFLLRRRILGRTLVLVGCGLSVLVGIAGVIVVAAVANSSSGVELAVGSGIGATMGLIFPIVTVILLVLPATTRWLRSA
ncbi:hypothetical protein [Williamsia deligens]|uniref:Uncharacterized protein n=1 Tax=Williamsia deligens TaxID=321325 RepID=A0ABW3G7Z9_9NOCA|nr:hypothetical protein [Williamsia deligens]MCP2192952.1 hypothetical protein [Williamsia deligens]